MNTGANDQQLKDLLEDTKALLAAAQGNDKDEIGRQLDKRQKSVDAVKSAGGIIGPRSDARKALINEILSLDNKACQQIHELTEKSSKAALDQQKKAAGVMKYNYDQYDLISGHMIDKQD